MQRTTCLTLITPASGFYVVHISFLTPQSLHYTITPNHYLCFRARVLLALGENRHILTFAFDLLAPTLLHAAHTPRNGSAVFRYGTLPFYVGLNAVTG